MSLDNVYSVLVGTTHPGNIGAAARALKTMGLSRLRLVAPKHYPHADATARASGADDVLASAHVFDCLDDALADCNLVVGLSARSRHVPWPDLTPRVASARIWQQVRKGKAAILYGQERCGLTNEELEKCHYLVQIPANPSYSSLNLAAAVQIMSYEIQLQALDGTELCERGEEPGTEAVDARDMVLFFEHLAQVLIASDFMDPENPRHVMRKLRKFFNRARPDRTEMNILRGILTAVQKSLG